MVKSGKITEETREKLRQSHLGQISFWKGKKLSEEHKNNLKKNHKGMIGKKHKKETRIKMSKSANKRVENGTHNLWNGGVSKTNHIIRNSSEYKLWREAVFIRDNWTCIWCGIKGGTWNKDLKKKVILNADHIKPFALYPELRFAIDNGRTLCIDCHKTTDTWGVKTNKTI